MSSLPQLLLDSSEKLDDFTDLTKFNNIPTSPTSDVNALAKTRTDFLALFHNRPGRKPLSYAVVFYNNCLPSPSAPLDVDTVQKFLITSPKSIFEVVANPIDPMQFDLSFMCHTGSYNFPSLCNDPDLCVDIASIPKYCILSTKGEKAFDVTSFKLNALHSSIVSSTPVASVPPVSAPSVTVMPLSSTPLDSTVLFEFIKSNTEQIRLEREDAIRRTVTPVQQDNQKRFHSISQFFDDQVQRNSIAYMYDPSTGKYSTDLNFAYLADRLQTLFSNTSHHYFLNLSKVQQLHLLLLEFSSSQLSLLNFLPPLDGKSVSPISTMDQLQLAFSALAYSCQILFGHKLASSIRSFQISIQELINLKGLSVEQLTPFINSRLQLIKLIPSATDNAFPFLALDDILLVDASQPSVQEYVEKSNVKSLLSMKNQIDILTSKVLSLSKPSTAPPKDPAKDLSKDPKRAKTTPNYSTKPKWTNTTDVDPCFYFIANKGACAGKTDCAGLTTRPHSWPAGATAAQKESFTKWIQSKDSPTYNK